MGPEGDRERCAEGSCLSGYYGGILAIELSDAALLQVAPSCIDSLALPARTGSATQNAPSQASRFDAQMRGAFLIPPVPLWGGIFLVRNSYLTPHRTTSVRGTLVA